MILAFAFCVLLLMATVTGITVAVAGSDAEFFSTFLKTSKLYLINAYSIIPAVFAIVDYIFALTIRKEASKERSAIAGTILFCMVYVFKANRRYVSFLLDHEKAKNSYLVLITANVQKDAATIPSPLLRAIRSIHQECIKIYEKNEVKLDD